MDGWRGVVLERIGRWTMAAYDNLLFIGASRQCFHQPPLCLRPLMQRAGPTNQKQAAKHVVTDIQTQNIHTHRRRIHKLHFNKHTLSYTHSDARNQVKQSRCGLLFLCCSRSYKLIWRCVICFFNPHFHVRGDQHFRFKGKYSSVAHIPLGILVFLMRVGWLLFS